MRAVQRKVFPGGAGTYVEPEIVAPPDPTQRRARHARDQRRSPISTRASPRWNSQMATLTGQIEQNGYRIRQLEEPFEAYKRATDARLTALEQGAATPPLDAAADAAPGGRRDRRAARGRQHAAQIDPAAPTPAADPDRAARLAAIERPATGDAGEDDYLYGYRLWEAKLYPEAEAQLKKVVAELSQAPPRQLRAEPARPLLSRRGQAQPRVDRLLRQLQEDARRRARARQPLLSSARR